MRGSGLALDVVARRESLRVRAVVVAIVVLLVLLTHLALEIDTGVRGFVRGEGLWSKARYEAMGHLERYLLGGEEETWAAFQAELAVPLADRRARLALDGPSYDHDAVVADLLIGRNHPDDIPTMIHLYRSFAWQQDFARAIGIWRHADGYVLELQALGAEIRAAYREGGPSTLQRANALGELGRIGRALAPLEHDFSVAISAAGRWVDRVLRIAMVSAALLLLAVAADALSRLTGRVYAAEERFRRTFEQAPVGMVQLGLDGSWLDANETMAQIVGLPRARLLGRGPFDLLGSPPAGAGEEDGDGRPPHVYRREDGREVALASDLTTIHGRDGRPLHHVAVVQDVTESRRLASELAHRARHDHLTGLLNRFEFEHRLELSIEHAARQGVPAALAFLDLDEFKLVNDTSGHGAGDALLVAVAAVLRGSIRTGDTLARLGGDEFVILLDGCELGAAAALVEHVRRAVRALEFGWEGRRYQLGVSIGLVSIDGRERDAAKVLSAADVACYTAKRRGRDRVHVADASQGAGTARLDTN